MCELTYNLTKRDDIKKQTKPKLDHFFQWSCWKKSHIAASSLVIADTTTTTTATLYDTNAAAATDNKQYTSQPWQYTRIIQFHCNDCVATKADDLSHSLRRTIAWSYIHRDIHVQCTMLLSAKQIEKPRVKRTPFETLTQS